MNRCQKCGCEEFIDTFKASGALIGRCKNCNAAVVIESSPEYEEHCRQFAASQQAAKRPPTITCPYCQSTNTSKISTTSRVVSVGLFGLGSKKIGKCWHCNKCGSDF